MISVWLNDCRMKAFLLSRGVLRRCDKGAGRKPACGYPGWTCGTRDIELATRAKTTTDENGSFEAKVLGSRTWSWATTC